MTQTQSTLDAALARLLAISGESPGLAEAVDYYMRLVPALHLASDQITTAAIDPDASQKKISAGIPLLVGEALGMDPGECRAVFRDICLAQDQRTFVEVKVVLGRADIPVRHHRYRLKPGGQGCPPYLIPTMFPEYALAVSRTAATSRPAAVRQTLKITAVQGAQDHGFPARRGQTGCRTQAIRRIIARVDAGELDPAPLLAAIACGDNRPLAAVAVQLGLDPGLLELMLQNTLKALLRALRAGLEQQVNLGEWRRGLCPFCGSPPALAEAQGVERARHLRCLRCGADWPYPNLRCAFCGSDDYRTLGILQVETEAQKQYVHTCDRCRRYIKTIITFEPTPVDLLIVEDLATLHLDRLAVDKGYR